MHTWLWSWLISFILYTSETNPRCCQNFVKFVMFDFFVYVLENYEKYFFEWVGPYLVNIKSLRLMEFFTKIVWIKAEWMSVTSVKSMKKEFLTFYNMLKNTQSMLMGHIFVLVFVVLIKYFTTWAEYVIIYSSSV